MNGLQMNLDVSYPFYSHSRLACGEKLNTMSSTVFTQPLVILDKRKNSPNIAETLSLACIVSSEEIDFIILKYRSTLNTSDF